MVVVLAPAQRLLERFLPGRGGKVTGVAIPVGGQIGDGHRVAPVQCGQDIRPCLVHHGHVDESRWVRFLGGPEDGEVLPVRLVDGRLPPTVDVPEYAAGRLVVHTYELLQDRPTAAKATYRWQDPQG